MSRTFAAVRGLVRQKQFGSIGKRARNRHALLLTTRKLRRPVIQTLAQAYQIEQPAGIGFGILAPLARDELRNDDILERGKFRQQMMELVDEADVFAPYACAFALR